MAKGSKRKCGASEGEDACGKVYECRFCSLKFCKSQAFSGHMKSHRQVRMLSFPRMRTRQSTRKRRSSAVVSCTYYTSRQRGRLKRGATTKSKKMLSTKTFESYLENLWRDISEDKRSSCAYLDCLWFASYMEGSFATNVLTWIKEKHIFSRKYVFVPIICWNHWNLLILCNFGEALGSAATTPCMLLLDSLATINPLRLEPGIRKFVLDVFRSEGRQVNGRFVSRIPLLVPKVPQQSNGEDCGIFVLHFIKLFLLNAPENFSISKGYPYFLKENWFDYKELEKFCEEICAFSSKAECVK